MVGCCLFVLIVDVSGCCCRWCHWLCCCYCFLVLCNWCGHRHDYILEVNTSHKIAAIEIHIHRQSRNCLRGAIDGRKSAALAPNEYSTTGAWLPFPKRLIWPDHMMFIAGRMRVHGAARSSYFVLTTQHHSWIYQWMFIINSHYVNYNYVRCDCSTSRVSIHRTGELQCYCSADCVLQDHANRKSNQQNLGTIHCSNLCSEIIEYTSPDEVAVCNLVPWRCRLPQYQKPHVRMEWPLFVERIDVRLQASNLAFVVRRPLQVNSGRSRRSISCLGAPVIQAFSWRYNMQDPSRWWLRAFDPPVRGWFP